MGNQDLQVIHSLNFNSMSDLKKFNETLTSERTQNYLQTLLQDRKGEFINNLTALVSQNRNLQACEPVTLLYAGLKATALNLPLDSNLGFAYVIPYVSTEKGITEAQFQIGYKGFIQLALRTCEVKTINVTDVREGEIISDDFVTGEMKFKRAENREELPVIGYVSYLELVSGFRKQHYMSVAQLQNHAQTYSQTYRSKKDYIKKTSKWTTDFDAMAKKTCLKLLLSKYAPMSIQLNQAIVSDQSVLHGMETKDVEYIDNPLVEDAQEISEDMAKKIMERNDKIKEAISKGSKKKAPIEDMPENNENEEMIF